MGDKEKPDQASGQGGKGAEADKKTVLPRPVRVARKIGEAAGNLRKREQWFRKRTQ